MAVKKSELYSKLWASCDELRGGMDASQYKDYVLVFLFIKYVSDKYSGKRYSPIQVPEGASFTDMVKLKGKSSIGDDINKKIVEPIAVANRLADMPDFNDDNKLGSGKEKVDRLTNLIAIFEDQALDFSKNKADGDDILGDAYEYLMRHFAQESGKSKGQFYTPAEVSRIMARIIGISSKNSSSSTTAYDPTAGSGSLLLKVAEQSNNQITLYGQEKDSATSGLARMNMILHDCPTAEIKQGNTLANPLFKDDRGQVRTFDYAVSNPPFSDKRWQNGLQVASKDSDEHGRFKDYGLPPAKNGDYAYLLHMIKSLKSQGKGAIILPHGVLFRGNVEAEIRKNLIQKGFIRGIIGLPANLFFGTGIPACIIVIDKENAVNRKGIFMIDAGKGFVKDGNKNRLREQDIHKIIDVFNKGLELPKFSRMVSFTEIEKNESNLNIPRYIDSQEAEDTQNIDAHLLGDIPADDIDALSEYWEVCPALRKDLFNHSKRKGFVHLKVETEQVKEAIFGHEEFKSYVTEMEKVFKKWMTRTASAMKELTSGCKPKEVIHEISENILAGYAGKKLIDKYDVYQHLMTYWLDVMQDDCYIISADGWVAETYRVLKENNKKKLVDKGWVCDLVPKDLVINRFFPEQRDAIVEMENQLEEISGKMTEMEEEHGGEDGAFSELEKVNKGNITARLKEIKGDSDADEERTVLNEYMELLKEQAALKKSIKDAVAKLDDDLYKKYPKLTEDEIKGLVVDDKWMATIRAAVESEMNRITQRLTQRIRELAERYQTPLPVMDTEVKELEDRVAGHLTKMGFSWK